MRWNTDKMKNEERNTDKMKNEKHLNLYQQKINEKLEGTDEIQNVQIEWNKVNSVIVEAAKE